MNRLQEAGRVMRIMKQGFVVGPDRTRVHYAAYGDGPAIVCTYGVGGSAVLFRYLVERFNPRCRVVTWDLPGHGLSFFPRSLGDVDVPTLAGDLAAVIDDLGISDVILIGHQTGVQICLEYYREHPARVAALVLAAGTFGHPLRERLGPGWKAGLFAAVAKLGYQLPSLPEFLGEWLAARPLAVNLAARYLVDGRCAKREDLGEYLGHLGRLDAQLFFAMVRAAEEHTAEESLHEVRAPTLLLAGENDRFTRPQAMKRFARLVPDAELLILKGAGHALFLEQPELVALRIEKFLRDRLPDGLDGPWGMQALREGVVSVLRPTAEGR